MNDVLERYLAQIERDLPAANRTDIIEEIADELTSQFEEREATLGRQLTAEEAMAIVSKYGRPRLVAGRYAVRQHLIGSDLLPYYWYALKVLVPLTLAVVFFSSVLRAVAFDNASQFWSGMANGWESPVWVVGIVTVIFIALQYSGRGLPMQWDPGRLPELAKDLGVSRALIVFEFIINVALIAAVLFAVSRWSALHTSIWQPICAAIIVSSAINAIALCVASVRARWVWARTVGQLIASVVSIGGLVLALRAVGSEQSPLRFLFAVFLIGMVVGAAVASWKLYCHSAAYAREASARGDSLDRFGFGDGFGR